MITGGSGIFGEDRKTEEPSSRTGKKGKGQSNNSPAHNVRGVGQVSKQLGARKSLRKREATESW